MSIFMLVPVFHNFPIMYVHLRQQNLNKGIDNTYNCRYPTGATPDSANDEIVGRNLTTFFYSDFLEVCTRPYQVLAKCVWNMDVPDGNFKSPRSVYFIHPQ